MEFEITYEIERRDFARANAAFFRASDRRRLGMWVLLASAVMLLLQPLLYKQFDPDWSYPAVVVPLAGYLVYLAALWVSPYLSGLIHYNKDYLAGKRFVARFSPEEVKVSGEHVAWIHQWPSFQFIRETKEQFVFYDGLTIYIFSKRYFTPTHKEQLRTLIESKVEKGRWVVAST